MEPPQLSKADAQVLAQVFDPDSGPTRAEIIVDPSVQPDRHVQDVALLMNLKAREKDAIRLIEEHEASSAEQRATEDTKKIVYEKAVAILDQLIAEYPEYASARNNRAQLRRWRFGDRNLLGQHRRETHPEGIAAVKTTVEDLREAIRLASPERSTDAISPSQGRLLGQAYTQLAALYYAASKDLAVGGDTELPWEDVRGWSKDAFEEEAFRLFYLGGLYGNEVAKALAVHTNPHAKLCGSIVKEAIRKELAQA